MKTWIAMAAAGVLAAGCAHAPSTGPTVTATLEPTKGNTAAGKATFVTKGDAVALTVNVTGLTPGPHGFHIHEKGDCSAPDGTSAGGHFNPTGKPHGYPLSKDHHAGDLPVLLADPSGAASLSAMVEGVSIGTGSANDIIGRALIVHKDPDDFTTQPTGNSGARVACGVIRRS